MARAVGWILALIAVFAILTGIVSRTNGAAVEARASVATPTATTAGKGDAGMVMPSPSGAAGVDVPSETQKLVCGDDLQEIVQQVLKLKGRPHPKASFLGGLYTCNYDLPMGRLQITVQHSATAAAALTYLNGRSHTVPAGTPLAGLGKAAYGNGDGIVITLKDNETLQVDTTGLPKVFGAEGQRRSDLAYEIASDVLGCWTDDAS